MSLPVTILGGYLGTGKTTLVNQMLRRAKGTRICVLVNEFGELPIDADLIEAEGDDLISIAGGCVCCSFGNDLAEALARVSILNPAPDHIVIEASGVALPGSIALTIGLLEHVSLQGILIVADAIELQDMAEDPYIGDTIIRQISDADMICLSKCDLLPEDKVLEQLLWLDSKWPNLPVIPMSQGEIPNEILLGEFTHGDQRQGQPHADDQYSSTVLSFGSGVDVNGLARDLNMPDLGIIRAKGFVPDISGRIALVQIAGRRAEVSWPDHIGQLRLVCIGLKSSLNIPALKQLQP